MINKIIDELSDNNLSLVNPLLKTKVIAKRIGNMELLNWVNNELNGYNELKVNSELPNYRIAKANTSCTLQLGYTFQENTPIPLAYIQDDELRDFFLKFPLFDGVQTLETYANNSGSGTVGKELSVDFWKMVTTEIRKSGAKLTIRNISVTTSIFSIIQTLSEIRSKFLDLMLAVEDEFPDISINGSPSDDRKKELNEKITLILKQVNITNSGDGSSINMGDNNSINTASGKNINQEINITQEQTQELEKLVAELKSEIIDKDFEEKSDIELEINRIENQLQKPEPKPTVIKQSLSIINELLLSITANVCSSPIIEGIKNILTSIG